MFFLGTLYLQRVLGYDPLEIGFAFLPATVVMGIFSAGLSARLTQRFGARTTLIPALGFLLAALGLFARVPVDGAYAADVLAPMLLLGVGAGLAFPSLMILAMSGASPEDAGLASGLVNTTAQVGGALGLAVLATLASSRTDDLLASGDSVREALTGGYRLSLIVGAVLVAIGIAVAVAVLRQEKQPSMAHAGRELESAEPCAEAA